MINSGPGAGVSVGTCFVGFEAGVGCDGTRVGMVCKGMTVSVGNGVLVSSSGVAEGCVLGAEVGIGGVTGVQALMNRQVMRKPVIIR